MATRLVVSTECPTCGAPLDFTEGTNAVSCAHCRSNLLVTGRKQVLSYFVAPRVEPQLAVSIARFAEAPADGPFRIGEFRLFFVPYYRLTGLDFRWQWTRVEPEGCSLEFRAMGENGTAGVDYAGTSAEPPMKEEIRIADRYIERNFIACDLEELGLFSLGVRPSVLRLDLFRRAPLEERGTIVRADVGVDRALEQGLKTPDAEKIEHREVIGRVLSVVYFPFWVAAIERRGRSVLTIVDAVSQAVVRRGAPAELLGRLGEPSRDDPPITGFRPLVCPNCGWDLPVQPDDVIFYCSACEHAWQLSGIHFDSVPCEVAEVPGVGREAPCEYLPFWVLDAHTCEGMRRFFVPAFRYRRLKHLSDVAVNLSRTAPSYSVSSAKKANLRGGYLDDGDASAFARFVHAGTSLTRTEKVRRDPIRVSAGRLTWFPFRVEPYSLCDPFTGTALAKNLLL